MNKVFQKSTAVITLVLALLLINGAIYNNEVLLEEGGVVFLKLAPVDPRSLMQGDYMALRFSMANDIQVALNQHFLVHQKSTESLDGLVNVSLDERGIASFNGITVEGENLKSKFKKSKSQKAIEKNNLVNNVVLQFRLRAGHIKFATNAYFFEEGSGTALENAEYGEFRVNKKGKLLLVALRDKDLNKLG